MVKKEKYFDGGTKILEKSYVLNFMLEKMEKSVNHHRKSQMEFETLRFKAYKSLKAIVTSTR